MEFTEKEYIESLNNIINDSSISDKETLFKKVSALFPATNTSCKYLEISTEELNFEINTIIDNLLRFLKTEDKSLLHINKDGTLSFSNFVDINKRNIAEVVVRVHKRKEYYRYFHNINNVSELKETALYCFWIMKLKPFTILKDDSPLRSSVNEMFSLNLILSQIQYLLIKKGENFKMPDTCFIQDTIYSFKYRDLSKEALILYVDDIANSYGITIDSWK